jgi:hypothetical protein
MLQHFNSLEDLLTTFSTDQKCADYLANLRWGNERHCPKCGNTKTWAMKKVGTYKCACDHIFTVKQGTIFEDSHLPLRKWFIAFWLEVNHTKGIASTQLAKDIGVTQKTAWYVLQRIRWALTHNTIEKLKNNVELDET